MKVLKYYCSLQIKEHIRFSYPTISFSNVSGTEEFADVLFEYRLINLERYKDEHAGRQQGPASCGGDAQEPRKAAGPAAAGRRLPVKETRPPKNVLLRPEKSKKKGAEAPLLTLRFKIISLLPPVCGQLFCRGQ